MRDEVKMDANRLIAEVYKRPALWNQRHISYHNREVTNRVWTGSARRTWSCSRMWPGCQYSPLLPWVITRSGVCRF